MSEQNRVWLYCRTANTDNIAMRMHTEKLKRYANESGYIITGVTEEGSNGLSINRYELKEMIAILENGKANVVLVKDVSRIARRSDQILEFIRLLRSRNASLKCMSGEDTTFLERLVPVP